jgi:gamma-glutamyl AIG2-like cyclotransferase
MDNSRDLPGYKYYVDAATGARPPVFVTYVDLVADAGCAVNGIVFPVEAEALAALDERERNYERRDVTGEVSPAPVGERVWAYFGRAEARDRFERGRAAGKAVVSRRYRDDLRDGFGHLGEAELRRFADSTDDPGVPEHDLIRVDIVPN